MGKSAKRRAGVAKVVYPTQGGTGSYTPDRNAGAGYGVPAEDAEPRAIDCAQCGYPLEDYAKYTTCPLCASDNFLGEHWSK